MTAKAASAQCGEGWSDRLPEVSLHAIQRVSDRWGVHEPAVAEWLVRETVRLGEIKVAANGSLHFIHKLPMGFTRVAIVEKNVVVTVTSHRTKAFKTAQRRKRQNREAAYV